jgi:RNA polymerase sigma-70 factor (ECF subfamily)
MSENPQHISQIDTLWTLVQQAHHAEGPAAAAQELLLRRYSSAILAYLTRVSGDSDTAADLFQEFAVRMLRGDFGGVTARRGRFRDYLKTSLRNLVVDYRRRQVRTPVSLSQDVAAAEVLPGAPADETGFDEAWRTELMDCAWRHLAELEASSGQPWHAVLRLRVERPEATSAELAEALSQRHGRAISDANLRKLLQRAREAFCDRLVAEVSGYVDVPERDAVEVELVDLGLHEWCKPALDRRFGPAKPKK